MRYNMAVKNLKPCPFCGCKRTYVGTLEGLYREEYYIWCTDCYCRTGNCSSIEEAIEDWNRWADIEIVNRQIAHAYWEPSEDGKYYCTHCGVECDIDKFHKALLNHFCGNCGAEMW